MKIKKWNYTTGEFDLQEIPSDPMFSVYEDDMNKTVKCISCGNTLHYASSYTSREILSEHNFGYCICMKCCNEESHRYNTCKSNLPPIFPVASLLFISKEEFEIFEKLYELQKRGWIKDLKLHPEITLRDAYTDLEKGYVESIKIHAVFSYVGSCYLPDQIDKLSSPTTYIIVDDISESTRNYIKEHCPSFEIVSM